jgi:hypothetical protein
VVSNGFGDDKNSGLWELAVHNDYLYAATAQWPAWSEGTHTGIEVWRTDDGLTWTQVNVDGFGDRDNMSPGMESFNGHLYVSTWNYNTGAGIWRCAACDGTDWTQVVSDSFGDSNNVAVFMRSCGDHFCACASNYATGVEVWRTANGTDWSLVIADGFGDSNNGSVWSGTVFDGRLFLGTKNGANGGEVWMMMHQVYLPLVIRNY